MVGALAAFWLGLTLMFYLALRYLPPKHFLEPIGRGDVTDHVNEITAMAEGKEIVQPPGIISPQPSCHILYFVFFFFFVVLLIPFRCHARLGQPELLRRQGRFFFFVC